MDIVLCAINTGKKTLQYAGAYNPLYIVRNNYSTEELSEKTNSKNKKRIVNSNMESCQLIELKPDRMPVGIHPRSMKSFTNQETELLPGDSVYLFTDGFVSQFGGKENKKLNPERFKKILCEINTLPMKQQKLEPEEILNEWRGVNQQVDDILIIGFKIA